MAGTSVNDDDVKSAILRTYGIRHPDPSTIDVKKDMSDFGFGTILYAVLTERLTNIAQAIKPTAQLDETDVENATTVQDCIDLTNAAAKT